LVFSTPTKQHKATLALACDPSHSSTHLTSPDGVHKEPSISELSYYTVVVPYAKSKGQSEKISFIIFTKEEGEVEIKELKEWTFSQSVKVLAAATAALSVEMVIMVALVSLVVVRSCGCGHHRLAFSVQLTLLFFYTG
jgi:hypothetical protein